MRSRGTEEGPCHVAPLMESSWGDSGSPHTLDCGRMVGEQRTADREGTVASVGSVQWNVEAVAVAWGRVPAFTPSD